MRVEYPKLINYGFVKLPQVPVHLMTKHMRELPRVHDVPSLQVLREQGLWGREPQLERCGRAYEPIDGVCQRAVGVVGVAGGPHPKSER